MQNIIIELKLLLIWCKKNVQTDYVIIYGYVTIYCDTKWNKNTP